MDKYYDIVVVGAGPAGMMAAGAALEMGAKVLLLDKLTLPGKKLLLPRHIPQLRGKPGGTLPIYPLLQCQKPACRLLSVAVADPVEHQLQPVTQLHISQHILPAGGLLHRLRKDANICRVSIPMGIGREPRLQLLQSRYGHYPTPR